MSFNIGFFSLKPNVGCTAMAIHVANYMAGSDEYSVALIERTGKIDDPEYHRVKTGVTEDGTFTVNKVHYYPEVRVINSEVWPLEYGPLEIEPIEDICIYDFGQVNFMYEFPEGMDKLYLVVDASDDNIDLVQAFDRDYVSQFGRVLPFDLVTVGASRDQVQSYKEGLAFISSVIPVTDKKEERLDYMFAMKLQLTLRGAKIMAPVYHDNWEYASVEFYSEEEWNDYWKGVFKQKLAEENKKKKKGFLGGSKKDKQKKKTEPVEEAPIIVPESELQAAKQEVVSDANVLECVEFEDVPEPTFVPSEPIVEESKPEKPAKEKRQKPKKNAKIKKEALKTEPPKQPKRVMSVRPEPEIHDPKKEVVDEKAEIIKAAEAFEPGTVNVDVSGEYKEHIVYEHNETETGLLGDIIDGINRGGHFCCNLYIVTRADQLFIFSNTDTFFEKLDVIKRELKDSSNIHYAVLTFNNEERKPRIFTEDETVTDETFQTNLGSLDKDLRTKRSFSDADIKKHMELGFFSEVVCA